jgi:hypothetical protein
VKRSALNPGRKSLERGSTFSAEPTLLKRGASNPRRSPIGRASDEQRAKVRHRACIVCAYAGPCHPAHIVDRAIGGGDDPRCVVPLCPHDHRLYDTGQLDLLPFLEPHWRDELAHAVELLGLVRALERVTNCRWRPEGAAS